MQNNGIASEIYSLINHEEVRPTANLVISKCTAFDYLNNSIPNIEKLTTQYYETFSITDRFTGYFSQVSIEDFFSSLSSEYCAPIAILGGLNVTARKEDKSSSSDSSGSSNSSDSSDSKGSMETSNSPDSEQLSEVPNVVTNPENLTAQTSSISGKRGTENLGIALFNDDVFCGELSAIESICHLLISNELNSCIISIDNPISNRDSEKMEIHLFPFKSSKVKVDIKDGKPYIYIKLFLEANVLTIDRGIDYKNEETILKISSETKKVLEEHMSNYLNKVSREYNADIDHFCAKAPVHFATLDEWKKFDWNEKFKSAEFNIDVELHN